MCVWADVRMYVSIMVHTYCCKVERRSHSFECSCSSSACVRSWARAMSLCCSCSLLLAPRSLLLAEEYRYRYRSWYRY